MRSQRGIKYYTVYGRRNSGGSYLYICVCVSQSVTIYSGSDDDGDGATLERPTNAFDNIYINIYICNITIVFL